MNKADKIFIAIVLSVCLLLWGTVLIAGEIFTGDSLVAIVKYKDEEVLRIDMNKDANYTVKGTLGDVLVEVKDKRIRVEKETSPYHICSIQGWVDKTVVPIVCLPNHIVIKIENSKPADDDQELDALIS